MNFSIHITIRIECNFRQAYSCWGTIPLAHFHCNFMDIFRFGEWQDNIIVHFQYRGAVVQVLCGNVCLIPVFIPGCNGKLTQTAQIVRAFQTGHIDHIIHCIFLVIFKCKNELFAFPPCPGCPVGIIIPVNNIIYIEAVGIFLRCYIISVPHLYQCNIIIGNPVQSGELWRDYFNFFRYSCCCQGRPAFTDLIQCRYINRIFCAVFQSANGG